MVLRDDLDEPTTGKDLRFAMPPWQIRKAHPARRFVVKDPYESFASVDDWSRGFGPRRLG